MATASLPPQVLQRLTQLSNLVPSSNLSAGQLSIEALCDMVQALLEDLKPVAATTPHISGFISRYGSVSQQLNSVRIKEEDFDTLKVLGRGGFGEVRLVRYKLNGQVYAMKLLRKSKMLTEREAAFFREERDVMAQTTSPWLVTLHFAFQNSEYLFLVMEYVQGGNLYNMLYKYESLEEETARFYIAETILAIEEMHKMNYVHRDIKPDNLLIDAGGHIKLTDFGSSIRLNAKGVISSDIAVGTPEYIAPEVLRAMEAGMTHGIECDWWSLGIMIYEMLVGEVPFSSESLPEMYSMIMNHKKQFKFPSDKELSDNAKDLIKRLICDKEKRAGFEDLKRHPFFSSINWDNIRSEKPPFVPQVKAPDDASNFEDVSDEEDNKVVSKSTSKSAKPVFLGEELNFVGYSYNRMFNKFSVGLHEAAVAPAVPVVQHSRAGSTESQPDRPSPLVAQNSGSSLTRQTRDLERKVAELQAKLDTASKDSSGWSAKYEKLQQSMSDLERSFQVSQAEATSLQKQVENERAAHRDIESLKREAERGRATATADLERARSQLEQEKKDRQALEESLRTQTATLQDTQRRLDEFIKSHSDLRSNTDSAAQEISQLKDKLAKKTKDLVDVQATATELQTQRTTLEAQLTQAKSDADREAAARKAAEQMVASTEQRLSELQGKLRSERERFDNERVQFESVASALRERLAKTQEDVSKQSESVKVEEQKARAVLELELAELRKKLKAANEAKNALEEELTDALNKIQVNDQNLNEAKLSSERAAAEARRAENRLQEQLKAAEQKLVSLEADLVATTKQVQVAKEEGFKQGGSAEATRVRQQADVEIAALEQKLKASTSTAESLSQEVAALNEKIKDLQVQTTKAAEQHQLKLERATADAKRAEARLQDQLKAAEATTIAKDNELSEARRTLQSLVHEVAAKSEDASQARTVASVELKEIRSRYEASVASIESLKRELAGLRDHVATTEKELVTARETHDKAVNEARRLYDELKIKLATTEGKLAKTEQMYGDAVQQQDVIRASAAQEARAHAQQEAHKEKVIIEHELIAAKAQLAASQSMNNKTISALAEAEAMLDELRESAEQDLADAKRAAEQRNLQNERAQAKLQEALQAKEAEVQRLANEVEEQKRQIALLKVEVQRGVETLDAKTQVEEQLAAVRKEVEALQNEQSRLSAQVESTSRAAEEKESQLHDTIKKLQTEIANATSQLNQVQNERDQLETTLNARTTEVQDLFDRIRKDREAQDEENKENAKLVQALESKIKDEKNAQATAEALALNEKKAMTSTIEALQQRIDTITPLKEQAEEQLASVRSRAAHLEGEVNELNTKLLETQDLLRAANADLATTKIALSNEISKLHDIQRLLERALDQSDTLMSDSEAMRMQLINERASWEHEVTELENKLTEETLLLEQRDVEIANLEKDKATQQKLLQEKDGKIKSLVDKLAGGGIPLAHPTPGGKVPFNVQQLKNEKRALENKVAMLEQKCNTLDRECQALREKENDSSSSNEVIRRPSRGDLAGDGLLKVENRRSIINLTGNSGDHAESFRNFIFGENKGEKAVVSPPSTRRGSVLMSGALEGFLKVRLPKKAQYGFRKLFVTVREFEIMLFDKSADKDNVSLAVATFNLGQPALMIRAAAATIRNVSEKELANTFMIALREEPNSLSSMSLASGYALVGLSNSSSVTTLSLPEDDKHTNLTKEQLDEKIKATQAAIQKETKILTGAKHMLAAIELQERGKPASTVAMQARTQVEGGNKKIAELTHQLESFQAALKSLAPSPTGDKSSQAAEAGGADIEAARAGIRKELEKEQNKKKGLEKLLIVAIGRPKDDANRQLAECTRRIATLKAELENPAQTAQITEFNGHRFLLKTYDDVTECQYCHEPLKVHQSAPNEGFSCQVCMFVCHRNCHPLISEDCKTVQELKDAPATFFMTNSPEEKFFWLVGLQRLRTQALTAAH